MCIRDSGGRRGGNAGFLQFGRYRLAEQARVYAQGAGLGDVLAGRDVFF